MGGEASDEEQVTNFMLTMRANSLEERKQYYLKNRINEQSTWYAKKASYNKSQGKIWFGILIGAQAAAIILILLRIAYPEWGYLPTEMFVVGAGGALTWVQVKRFRELTAAYGITAHEIGIIKGEVAFIKTKEGFSNFVKDSENAFSREHTQWVARKVS